MQDSHDKHVVSRRYGTRAYLLESMSIDDTRRHMRSTHAAATTLTDLRLLVEQVHVN